MNEKQLNENLGISKSLNIHTASLDTFFFFTIRGTLFFLLYFIFKIYRFIFNHSYFYCQQFIKDICICIFSFCHSNLNYSYIYIYIHTHTHIIYTNICLYSIQFFSIKFAILLSCTFLPLGLVFLVGNYGSDFISFFETLFLW